MATTKKFSLNRIKSLLEYNMRYTRIKGFEYEESASSSSNGLADLKSDSELTTWDNSTQPIEIPTSPKQYMLYDNNINLRDAIAKTIYDVLSGSGSTESKTASNTSWYQDSPAGGNNSNDGSGFYIELDSAETFQFKVGNYILKIDVSGIFISGDNGETWVNVLTHTHLHTHSVDVADVTPPAITRTTSISG